MFAEARIRHVVGRRGHGSDAALASAVGQGGVTVLGYEGFEPISPAGRSSPTASDGVDRLSLDGQDPLGELPSVLGSPPTSSSGLLVGELSPGLQEQFALHGQGRWFGCPSGDVLASGPTRRSISTRTASLSGQPGGARHRSSSSLVNASKSRADVGMSSSSQGALGVLLSRPVESWQGGGASPSGSPPWVCNVWLRRRFRRNRLTASTRRWTHCTSDWIVQIDIGERR